MHGSLAVTMKSNAIKTDSRDNVAVALQPISKSEAVVVNGQVVCCAVEDIALGHKICLLPIAGGDAVIRYGETIVKATRDICQGEWVHVHNTHPISGGSQE